MKIALLIAIAAVILSSFPLFAPGPEGRSNSPSLAPGRTAGATSGPMVMARHESRLYVQASAGSSTPAVQ